MLGIWNRGVHPSFTKRFTLYQILTNFSIGLEYFMQILVLLQEFSHWCFPQPKVCFIHFLLLLSIICLYLFQAIPFQSFSSSYLSNSFWKGLFLFLNLFFFHFNYIATVNRVTITSTMHEELKQSIKCEIVEIHWKYIKPIINEIFFFYHMEKKYTELATKYLL